MISMGGHMTFDHAHAGIVLHVYIGLILVRGKKDCNTLMDHVDSLL